MIIVKVTDFVRAHDAQKNFSIEEIRIIINHPSSIMLRDLPELEFRPIIKGKIWIPHSWLAGR